MSNITKLLVLSIFLTGCSGINNKNHHAHKDHHCHKEHKDHHCHKDHHHIKGKHHNAENDVSHSVSAHSGHVTQNAAATADAVTRARP